MSLCNEMKGAETYNVPKHSHLITAPTQLHIEDLVGHYYGPVFADTRPTCVNRCIEDPNFCSQPSLKLKFNCNCQSLRVGRAVSKQTLKNSKEVGSSHNVPLLSLLWIQRRLDPHTMFLCFHFYELKGGRILTQWSSASEAERTFGALYRTLPTLQNWSILERKWGRYGVFGVRGFSVRWWVN